jgi:hypothetical protein
MVLTVGDARASAAWLLPLLCVGDIMAVAYWRRHAAAWRLFSLAPWTLAGMAGGAAALGLSEHVLRPLVGVIVLVMLAVQWIRQRSANPAAITPHPGVYGVSAGFATTVANAASPVMNLYLLSKKLPKEEFIATGAWFFFFINLTKIPIYAWRGLFSGESLMFDLAAAPAVIVGALFGRRVVDWIPQRLFDQLVVAMSAVSALLLFR